ncbi:MAG: Xaa-Pro peptidase family protein [Peptococcaceae bacterium]|nr:Xaa-Pro peptidase family protein [Peptococcaceae bacterium]
MGKIHSADRIDRLRQMLPEAGVDAFLVTGPENRFYLTGFTGSSGWVVVTEREACLITDFRYEQQARAQSPKCRIIVAGDTLPDALGELAAELKVLRVGCEGDDLTYNQYVAIRDKLPGCEVRPLAGTVEGLRAIKEEFEIGKISAAVKLADEAFLHILPYVRDGVRERDVALEIEFFMRKEGAEGASFPLIVASGHRAAMPHGTASDKVIRRGELVIIDLGASLEGYNSDMTRTVAVGGADKKMEEIYRVVLEAQLAGIKAIRGGVTASEVDRAARSVIEGHGYGDYFGHSTGHGLGLQIHESPRLSARDNTELKPGMVVTVEPGIYLPGWGGVRIEDTVVVEENGCCVLTSSPKDRLIICGKDIGN